LSPTCFEQPSVHHQEDLYIEFYSFDTHTHPDIDQTVYKDALKNTTKLHVQLFLMMNT
jgi:hypothetical protein